MDYKVMLRKAFGIMIICLGAYLIYFYETRQTNKCSASFVEQYGACPGNAKKNCIYVGIPSILLGIWIFRGYKPPANVTIKGHGKAAATSRSRERVSAASMGRMTNQELGAFVREHLMKAKESDGMSS